MSRRAVDWTPGMPGIKWSAAHNSFLQAGAELGIPGLLLFCTLVVGCIMAPWKLRRRIPPAWATGDWEQRYMYQAAAFLPLAALGFAVPAFFVSFAYHDPIYILAAFVGALTAAVPANSPVIARCRSACSVQSLSRESRERSLPALRDEPVGQFVRRRLLERKTKFRALRWFAYTSA